MRPESRKYLWDALQAADRIAQFVSDKSFDAYAEDDLLRSAVERQFEIVGEALAQLRNVDAETAASVPELPRIVAFRNILVHGYATVDDRIVWGVVEGSLPALREPQVGSQGELVCTHVWGETSSRPFHPPESHDATASLGDGDRLVGGVKAGGLRRLAELTGEVRWLLDRR